METPLFASKKLPRDFVFPFFAFLLGIPFCFHALSSDQISSWAGGGMCVGNSQCLPAQPPILLPGCQARATAHEMCPAVPAVASTWFRYLFNFFSPSPSDSVPDLGGRWLLAAISHSPAVNSLPFQGWGRDEWLVAEDSASPG